MTPTSKPWAFVAGLGLFATSGCVGDLDVGKRPFIDIEPTSTDGPGSSDGGSDGLGVTSGVSTGTTANDSSGSSDGSSDDSTGEPSDTSPPCELGAAGPGQDPSLQWGIVCGGQSQEVVNAVAIDGTGAVYVVTQVEGVMPSTVLMGDDEIASGPLPSLLITKLAPDGNILWNRSFIGEQTWWYGRSIAVCNDRVFITANRSYEMEAIDFGTGLVDGNMAVVAFDGDGQTQWAMATGQDTEFAGGFPVGSVQCRGDGVVVHGVTAVDLELGGVMLEGDVDTANTSYVVVLDAADGSASWGGFDPSYAAQAALGPTGELVTLGYGVQAATLIRHAADGTVQWQQDFPTTGGIELGDIAIDELGNITISGGYGAQIDLGQGPFINGDPPPDPADPFALQPMDGFVASYAANGTPLWSTSLAELGHDYVAIAGLMGDGTPAVLWTSPTATSLLAVDGIAEVPIATLPGMYHPQAMSGDPSGGLAFAWADPSGLSAFAPPLTARGGYDFMIVRLDP